MQILLADDHRLLLEAVKTYLLKISRNVKFLLALDADELEALVSETVDLAIVDLSMPGAQGYSHIDKLHSRYPALPVIILSDYSDPELIHSVLERGVRGFIPKAYSPEVMLLAVRLVLAGGIYVPPSILPALKTGATTAMPLAKSAIPAVRRDHQLIYPITTAVPNSNSAESRNHACPATLECLRSMLTKRQVEVLELLSQGKPNKLIGRTLNISEGTVKIHLAAIFRSLNVRNRTEAVVAAQSFTSAREL